MGTRGMQGFTIIEVILFLAITGLMLAAMLVGVAGTINRSRYDDAVNGLLDYMQGQYNLVTNVRNNNTDGAYSCSGGVVQAVGTSNCTIVGRIISSSDGQHIVSKPIISTQQADLSATSESAMLASMSMQVASQTSDDESFTMSWDTLFYTDPKKVSSSQNFAALMIRMPDSAAVRTYALAQTAPTDLSVFWTTPDATVPLCVNPKGLIGSKQNGVLLTSKATNSSGVSFIAAGDGVCL